MIKKIILIICLLALPGWAAAADYYVNCAASAGGDGSALTPWDAVADVNGATFSADDNVYFNRGCTFRSQLTLPSSGTDGHPITFGAYGTGDKPVIWAMYGNAKDYITFQDITVPGNFTANGAGWVVSRTRHGGDNCWNFGTTGSSVNFADAGGSGTNLWSWGVGTTDTNADPANADFTTSAKRYHSVCFETPAGKTISSPENHIIGDIGQLPTGLTGGVSLAAASALTGNIGQLPIGLTSSVSLNAASALTYTSVAWPLNSGNSKIFSFNAATLNQAMVDDILCDLDVDGTTGGTLNISAAAAPTSTGTTCANALVAKGWTLVPSP